MLPPPPPQAVSMAIASAPPAQPSRSFLLCFVTDSVTRASSDRMPKPVNVPGPGRQKPVEVDVSVATDTVKVPVPPAVRLSDEGEIVQVAFTGAPVQVSATVPLKFALPVSDRL